MILKNKTVLLTGASGGIGEAFARALARAGVRLILVSRGQDKLDALLAALPGQGHCAVVADLTASEGRQAVVDVCRDCVDILINTAGVNHFGLLDTQSEEQIRSMFEVNTLAPILLTQALLPQLLTRESAIINVGSGYGSIGFAGYCGYSASKFALRGFTEALRRELADSSVSVQYLAPRATATDMNPDTVMAMNAELGNAVDDPDVVAAELMALLAKSGGTRYMGWPERFFIMLNGLFPAVVNTALAKKLHFIRRQAVAASSHPS
jgi:short-subunit dehydrogenase